MFLITYFEDNPRMMTTYHVYMFVCNDRQIFARNLKYLYEKYL
jgi:hypothetical protein